MCNIVFAHIKYMDRYKGNHDDRTGSNGTANIKYPFKLYAYLPTLLTKGIRYYLLKQYIIELSAI